MSSIRRSISIAAGQTVDDFLEFANIRLQQRTAQVNGVFSIAFTQSAAGILAGIFAGARAISTNTEPVVKSIAPVLPDDLSGTFPIATGEQVSVPITNPTAGAITLGLFIDVP